MMSGIEKKQTRCNTILVYQGYETSGTSERLHGISILHDVTSLYKTYDDDLFPNFRG